MAENEQNKEQEEQEGQEQAGAKFTIERIYLKDMSFESPKAPEVFTKPWSPLVEFDLNIKHQQLQEGIFEVVLALTVTVKNQVEGEEEKETAYLVEVQQAGIFGIAGLEPAQLAQVIGTTCPTVLYPYARETVDNLVQKGSFRPLHLAPINFDALYAQKLQEQTAAQSGQATETVQ